MKNKVEIAIHFLLLLIFIVLGFSFGTRMITLGLSATVDILVQCASMFAMILLCSRLKNKYKINFIIILSIGALMIVAVWLVFKFEFGV